jgi:hypothetical protein
MYHDLIKVRQELSLATLYVCMYVCMYHDPASMLKQLSFAILYVRTYVCMYVFLTTRPRCRSCSAWPPCMYGWMDGCMRACMYHGAEAAQLDYLVCMYVCMYLCAHTCILNALRRIQGSIYVCKYGLIYMYHGPGTLLQELRIHVYFLTHIYVYIHIYTQGIHTSNSITRLCKCAILASSTCMTSSLRVGAVSGCRTDSGCPSYVCMYVCMYVSRSFVLSTCMLSSLHVGAFSGCRTDSGCPPYVSVCFCVYKASTGWHSSYVCTYACMYVCMCTHATYVCEPCFPYLSISAWVPSSLRIGAVSECRTYSGCPSYACMCVYMHVSE